MAALSDMGWLTLRLALGMLAFLAAAHKILDIPRSRRATRALMGSAGAIADLGWLVALLLEATGAIATWTGMFDGKGPLFLALVWLAYALALVKQQDADDCGCGFGRRSPPHRFGLTRNLALVLLAIAAATTKPTVPDLAGLAAAAPAALFLIFLYLAADELGSHPRPARSRT